MEQKLFLCIGLAVTFSQLLMVTDDSFKRVYDSVNPGAKIYET